MDRPFPGSAASRVREELSAQAPDQERETPAGRNHQAFSGFRRREIERLRDLIQGKVIPIAAKKLKLGPEIGLENDLRYKDLLEEFVTLIVSPGIRRGTMSAFLEERLPEDTANYMKVLFIEAATRILGRRWTADTCQFAEVSIATARLQQLLHALSHEFRMTQGRQAPMAILLSPDAEQHTLMIRLLGLLFESVGWRYRHVGASDPGLEKALSECDVVCLNWGNSRLQEDVDTLIAAVNRVRDGGRHPPIVAGGAAAQQTIAHLVRIGVDCICDCVYSAVSFAEYHLLFNKESISCPASLPTPQILQALPSEPFR